MSFTIKQVKMLTNTFHYQTQMVKNSKVFQILNSCYYFTKKKLKSVSLLIVTNINQNKF